MATYSAIVYVFDTGTSEITEGTNLVRINIGSSWKLGIPYIKIGNEWKLLTMKINISSVWDVIDI